jgi:hypothetical protein
MKHTDPEIMAARLSAVEVLLFALAQSVPKTTLASHFTEQKQHALASLRGSAVADRIIEHTEQTLARYEKALGL